MSNTKQDSMDTNNTSYQVTKTVRFKLEAVNQAELAIIKNELLKIRPNSSDEMALDFYLNDKGNDESLSVLQTLNTLLEKAIDKLEHLIYQTDSNNNVIHYEEQKPKWSSVEIKYVFLRTYLKYDFYRFKEAKYGLTSKDTPPKKYKVNDEDIQFFRDEVSGSNKIIGLIQRLQEIQDSIADFTKRQTERQHEKKRFSEIALVLGNLTKRNNLEFLKALTSALVIPNNDKKGLDNVKNELSITIADIESIVNQKLTYFTPFKSSMGFQTRGGSFNYYTINKEEKELQAEEESLKKELAEIYSDNRNGAIISTLKITSEVFVEFYVSLIMMDKNNKKTYDEVKADILKQYNLEGKDLSQNLRLNMVEMYKFIKLWKDRQKTDYQNALKNYDNDKSAKYFVDNNLLFKFFDVRYYMGGRRSIDGQKVFEELKSEAKLLQKLSKEKSNDKTPESRKKELLKEIKALKQKIGGIFYRKALVNYIKLCDYFQTLAVRYGEIKARLADIEKDKAAAKLLHYWCVIVEQNFDKYLYLIPSEDSICAAYNEISSVEKTNKEGNCKVFYFESLTLAALRKLLFKENNNRFKRGLPENFPKCEQYKIKNEYGRSYRIIMEKTQYRNVFLFSKQHFMFSIRIESFPLTTNRNYLQTRMIL